MRKGKKIAIISGSSATGVLLIAAVLYAFVFTNIGTWFLSTFQKDTPQQVAAYSSASGTTEAIEEEGNVLLKNTDNLLPLKSGKKINAFGIRSVQLVYNGGGSSASNVEGCTRLEEAMKKGGFELNPDLLNLNYNYYKDGKVSIKSTAEIKNGSASEFVEHTKVSNLTIPEVPASAYSNTSLYDDGKTIMDHAVAYSDVAMVFISRGAAELYDFTPKELRLSDDEKGMIDSVCSKFSNVILVVNTANQFELGFLDDHPQIKSVLWIGYPGQDGMTAFAKIINGTVNPSGHLVDTWARDNSSAPAVNNYDSYAYKNLASGQKAYFINYAEGIYVGYRYYETRYATDPKYDYNKEVVFPFGYGLSYTKFEQRITDMKVNKDAGTVEVRVGVMNTGDVAGKDAIEIYYTPPYNASSGIEKSSVNLVAFKKTNIIEPKKTEYYTLTFDIQDMASYDYAGKGCYVLEKGSYKIDLMSDAHNLIDSKTWDLSDTIVYDSSNKRSTDKQTAVNQFENANGFKDYLSRSTWDQKSRAFTGPQASDYTAPQDVLNALTYVAPTDESLGLTKAPITGVNAGLKLSDMKSVAYEDSKWDTFVQQLSVDQLTTLVSTGAWKSAAIKDFGIPSINMPDGATGLFSTMYSGAVMGTKASGVTYPIPAVLASTWNVDLASLMGQSVAIEAKAMNYYGWYAPAMNIHRTALNARNFEYYSEDGLISGKMAAGVIKKVTDGGVICFIKHFAMNERESNDRDNMFTWSNEQAIREIYLKPFEIAVKEGAPLGVMSAFDYIGPTWCGGNEALLTQVLRNEWGFKGTVITDAAVYGYMYPVEAIHAGNDLMLDVMKVYTGKGKKDELVSAVNDSKSKFGTIAAMQKSAKNILYSISRTGAVQ